MPNFRKHYSEEQFLKMRNEQRKRNYSQTAQYKRRDWIPEEDEAVLKQDITDRELSKIISRSVQSIQIRRSRLKKEAEINNKKAGE